MILEAKHRGFESNDRAALRLPPTAIRLVYALVLIPIVPATAIIVETEVRRRVSIPSFLDSRLTDSLISCASVFLLIVIWRKAVVWTLGRKWLTALVSLIPFVQVVYAQPLWQTDCGHSITLRLGQHTLGLGLWVWALIWVWWGWEHASGASTVVTKRILRMSSTAKRIVASIGSLPVVAGCMWIIGAASWDFTGIADSLKTPLAFALTVLLAIFIWLAIWAGAIQWSFLSVGMTMVAAIICFGFPLLAQLLSIDETGYMHDAATALVVAGWGLWMGGTVRFWPVKPISAVCNAVTPRCLCCGYSLIGLRATRCPECGDEPTMEKLWQGTIGEVT